MVSCAALTGIGMAGCAENGLGVGTNRAAVAQTQMATSPPADAAGASVMVAGISGAPEAISQQFSQLFNVAAASRHIDISQAQPPQYFAKGYLSASATAEGTQFNTVWDVFDQSKKYVTRINDVLVVKSSNTNVWQQADPPSLKRLAESSADAMASFFQQFAPPKAPAAVESVEPVPLAYAPIDR